METRDPQGVSSVCEQSLFRERARERERDGNKREREKRERERNGD